MNKKITIIYHRVDYDGLFSALICKHFFDINYPSEVSINTLGFTYGDTLPDLQLLKENSDKVIMVDISFPVDYMLKLIESIGKENIVWIDHHITAIRDSIRSDYNDLPGLRDSETNKGACELTWEWFFKDIETPKIIKYLSAYDVWDKNRFSWDKDILPCQNGLRALFGMNLEIISQNPNQILSEGFLETQILPGGRMIKSYLSMKWRTQVKNSTFDITVAGKYKGIAILSPDFSSAMFESVLNKYQVFCICNVKRDSDVFSVSLYSEPDGRLGDFELGEYMKQYYSGGGHKTAAGGKLTKEQFNNLIYNKVI